MTTEPTAKLTRYRHKKRGTTYEVIGRGILQATEPPIEGDQMVAYKSVETGDIWFRPETEFEDGRFEELPALASLTPPSDDAIAARMRELEGALTELIDETVDYMTINHLGDPEKQHAVKRGREALQKELK